MVACIKGVVFSRLSGKRSQARSEQGAPNSPSRVFGAAPSLRACLASHEKGEKITLVIQAT